MAQDIVVKERLSDGLTQEGAALVEHLDNTGWQVIAAFWYYFADADAWRLVLASPEVDAKGPRAAYTAIQGALAQLEPGTRELALEDISVVPPDHPLVGLLGMIIHTGPGLARIRLSRNVINGRYIDDALIYRLS